MEEYMKPKKMWMSLNVKKRCAEYRVGLWECPQFLFIVMGAVIIGAILVTYIIAQRFVDPEISALVVLALTAALFVVGNFIVNAFEHVARAARAKSEFVGIMSHQLRSPLSAIKWQLDVLFSEKPRPMLTTVGEVQKYLETIQEQNERMIQAVNDLLEVNRIEDGDVVLRPSTFSFVDLSQHVIDEYQKRTAGANARLSLEVRGVIPEIFADEERIKNAMRRFLDNAIRYSIHGGDIVVTVEHDNRNVIWSIIDQGAGISAVDQRRVFEKFFRSPHTMQYQTSGSGVGLFIAKSIISLSGGRVGFSSQLDHGSTFWFSLPLRPMPAPKI